MCDIPDCVHVCECLSNTVPIQWAKTKGCCIPAGVSSSRISHQLSNKKIKLNGLCDVTMQWQFIKQKEKLMPFKYSLTDYGNNGPEINVQNDEVCFSQCFAWLWNTKFPFPLLFNFLISFCYFALYYYCRDSITAVTSLCVNCSGFQFDSGTYWIGRA
jgi:hypothetical protein